MTAGMHKVLHNHRVVVEKFFFDAIAQCDVMVLRDADPDGTINPLRRVGIVKALNQQLDRDAANRARREARRRWMMLKDRPSTAVGAREPLDLEVAADVGKHWEEAFVARPRWMPLELQGGLTAPGS